MMLLRRHKIVLSVFLATAIAAVLAGCGGQQNAPESTGTVTPMSEAQRETNALPLAQMASIPKGLNCKGEIVWANTTKKTYHESGDPYYGRTKHGEYMCKAAADAAGYHMAGTRHKHMKSSAPPTPYGQ